MDEAEERYLPPISRAKRNLENAERYISERPYAREDWVAEALRSIIQADHDIIAELESRPWGV